MKHPTEQAIVDVADSISRKNRRIQELEAEVEWLEVRNERLIDILARITEHWEDGVNKEEEANDSWHGTMREILQEAVEATE